MLNHLRKVKALGYQCRILRAGNCFAPRMPALSPALKEYLPAFAADKEPFLTFHAVQEAEKPRTWTRGEFFQLAQKAAFVLRGRLSLAKGDCHVHLFKGNSIEDLALRLASIMVGTIPVTVNWDSDNLERVVYKVKSSCSRVVFCHSHTPREHVEGLKASVSDIEIVPVDSLSSQSQLLDPTEFEKDVQGEDTRIIIYTSGSSGEPKGVRLSYDNYVTNRLTFRNFLKVEDPAIHFMPVLVNPLHHTNTTSFSDWAMRRPGTHMHLFERYSTCYWSTVSQIALNISSVEEISSLSQEDVQRRAQQLYAKGHRLVCPTVSRHFDYLETVIEEKRLKIKPKVLRAIAPVVTFLLGSAPVGPTTVARLLHHLGRLPAIRFGSTETCLQVLGTDIDLPQQANLRAFQRGWDMPEQQGFYVGRPHPPHTEVRVVKSLERGSKDYLLECEAGVRGYLITRGKNVMSGYVQGVEATCKAIDYESGGWYLNLGDIFFYLHSEHDGEKDYYWVSRVANLLIRGGANYSYDQISKELGDFLSSLYNLPPTAFDLRAVGLRASSEHEDDCLVTVELIHQEAKARREEIQKSFLTEAAGHVTKGAKPSHLRFDKIPRNFKGDVNWRDLERLWQMEIGR